MSNGSEMTNLLPQRHEGMRSSKSQAQMTNQCQSSNGRLTSLRKALESFAIASPLLAGVAIFRQKTAAVAEPAPRPPEDCFASLAMTWPWGLLRSDLRGRFSHLDLIRTFPPPSAGEERGRGVKNMVQGLKKGFQGSRVEPSDGTCEDAEPGFDPLNPRPLDPLNPFSAWRTAPSLVIWISALVFSWISSLEFTHLCLSVLIRGSDCPPKATCHV